MHLLPLYNLLRIAKLLHMLVTGSHSCRLPSGICKPRFMQSSLQAPGGGMVFVSDSGGSQQFRTVICKAGQ